MERTGPRPRRQLARWQITLLRPILRYSYSRDAYVLRLIGGRRGPVITPKPPRAFGVIKS